VSSPTALQNWNPDVFFLDARDLDSLTAYLLDRGWMRNEERVLSAAPAGEGNMNYTLRIGTSQRSFVMKQARPWVEKYPHISAPWDRALMEAQFYNAIQADRLLAAYMPGLLGFDPDARILVLEDFGAAPDFTHIYSDRSISSQEIESLTGFLVGLHSRFRNASLAGAFANTEMRKLNHEHIFEFPLRPENALNLDGITPGLAGAARKLQQDPAYRNRVAALGDLYLGAGQCLIHGDYFPGSWLGTSEGVRVIDPEFCFFGQPEFELGVMIAHLHLALCPAELGQDVMRIYRAAGADADLDLTRQFAGVEIMRRLIGVAQLPLPYGLQEKRRLLEMSYRMVAGA
jgi:5-methylthioribose kinase